MCAKNIALMPNSPESQTVDCSRKIAPPLVLVVEDDIDTRSLILQLLESEGFLVEAAADGGKALERLARAPYPDLILLDLSLPDMTGADVMRAVQAHPYRQKSKVLVCSGWDNLPARAKELFADGAIRKPYNVDEFLRTIRKALELPQ